MDNQLIIRCKKIEDRIREQELAEKRGWSGGCYGIDSCSNGKFYYVEYSKLKRRNRND